MKQIDDIQPFSVLALGSFSDDYEYDYKIYHFASNSVLFVNAIWQDMYSC